MNKRIILGFLSLSFIFWFTEISYAQPNLLFKSGFESGVAITGSGIRKNIRGTDSSSGYTWETDMPGAADKSAFNYLVCRNSNLEDYVRTRIETVIGPQGTPTKALYQTVVKSDPCSSATSRSQYNIYPGGSSATDKLEQIYVRYWTKLESNLPSVLKWRLIMEWLNKDYRWGIYIYQDEDSGPSWQIQGEFLPEKTSPWRINNQDIPVPIDEWFLLEVFWKQDTGSDGQLWVAVNGDTVADYHGSNKRSRGIGAWCIFKNYGSIGSGQWIDDVEVWDNIPNPNLQRPKLQTLDPPSMLQISGSNLHN